ncbi:hypothetical protein [Sulfurisphaera ohwakuensis]|uniref:Uncharacterized protein n=1 Tax=Sulfurisphaera ohwakuensis TaxID=69656 RepID=A0A650CJX6_SULOH|nr:hypothetical protein [Sulfurisphaera ohwakuensis]MBB5253925.1 hypothetical protein [Sulfurisphaera ohwakuensis]QGR17985.1 hypothetical protein D1869_12930 [Sulfurisphaera ohwakuensis]
MNEEVISILWKVIDNDIPLVNDDMHTFLIKDGEITEEDLKIWNDAVKKIKEAYKKLIFNENEAKSLLNSSLELLNSIKPKKPFPPEVRIRFEELKTSVAKCIELISKA